MEKDITLIIGPTAVGKSKYAIDLAKKIDAEIISADAYQVYKDMQVGTAKLHPEDMNGIPHHLIDERSPQDPYTVSHFLTEANQRIKDIRKRGKKIIICGGTGLYIESFLFNFQNNIPKSNPAIRENLTKECNQIGKKAFWEKLNNIDPKTAKIIPYQNSRRTIRALEIFEQTGQMPSTLKSKSETPREDCHIIGLTLPKEILHQKIEARVHQMVQQGLIEEVQSLLDKGFTKEDQALQALGYKETIDHIQGQLTKKELIETITTKTRQFAKRQMTWFNRLPNVKWIEQT